MKVQNVEGVAIHDGPESCVGAGNRTGEALTGERTGWVLSREIHEPLRSADALEEGGRQYPMHRHREVRWDSARSETPSMCGSTACGNREIPGSPVAEGAAGRIGKSKDERR